MSDYPGEHSGEHRASTPARKRALILCTGNSARSQMAEAFWRRQGSDRWEAYSAGVDPKVLNPLAIQVMSEVGIDISKQRSKSVDEFDGQAFDLVVTVCDNAADLCPAFPGAKRQLHWPFDDPPSVEGTHEQRMRVWRRVRDEIEERIRMWLEKEAAHLP